MADRVVVVAGGRVIADWTSAEIKAGASGRTISLPSSPERALGGLPAVTAVSRRGDAVSLATTDPFARRPRRCPGAGRSSSPRSVGRASVNGDKSPETRQRRIEKAVALFREGKQR